MALPWQADVEAVTQSVPSLERDLVAPAAAVTFDGDDRSPSSPVPFDCRDDGHGVQAPSMSWRFSTTGGSKCSAIFSSVSRTTSNEPHTAINSISSPAPSLSSLAANRLITASTVLAIRYMQWYISSY